MSNAKMTVAAVNEELMALKTAFEAQASFINELCGKVTDLRLQIEALEVSNVQLRAELLEVRATKSVAKPAAQKPTEAKQEDGVYTFIPPSANVTAVATKSREAVRLDGQIVKCTPAVWAFWRTTLERRAKASAREQAQYEEYCA
jgi:hypothetical protein